MPASSPLPRINGGRPRTNEYLFDGISVLQPEPGQVAFFPVIDAIQEFKIESNSAPAEFGRFNGGVINLTTKSGANAFHGDGFEFFRNEALNARPYNFQSTIPPKPCTGAISSAAPPAARSSAITRFSSSTIRASASRSGARRYRWYRRSCSVRGFLPRRSAAGCRPSSIPRRLQGQGGRNFRGTPFLSAAWIRSPSRSCNATRCPRRPGRPTTTAGPTTKSTIRTSGTPASITASRTATRRSAG